MDELFNTFLWFYRILEGGPTPPHTYYMIKSLKPHIIKTAQIPISFFPLCSPLPPLIYYLSCFFAKLNAIVIIYGNEDTSLLVGSKGFYVQFMYNFIYFIGFIFY